MIESRVVALCTAEATFLNNLILAKEHAKKYHGTLWIPELASKLLKHGVKMVTGDVALQMIKDGEIKANNVLVIREDLCSQAEELLRLGAKGKVLLCGESPLFANSFYQSLSSLSKSFEHCIVFRGTAKDAIPILETHTLYFPSYEMTDLRDSCQWESRKYLVMIAGNKYWRIRRSSNRKVAAKIRDVVLRKPRRFSKKYASLQLHDERLKAISYFGGKGLLDLYGDGWESLKNLPIIWQKALSTIMTKINPTHCPDKLSTIAEYKFALCFENIKFPGYVTEKLIHCMVAGVIPIYWGAPDIQDFVPPECFINGSEYRSLEKLEAHLETISELEWSKVVNYGREFLKSRNGKQYSYSVFAEQMESMLIS